MAFPHTVLALWEWRFFTPDLALCEWRSLTPELAL
jgi:hypothetical protein